MDRTLLTAEMGVRDLEGSIVAMPDAQLHYALDAPYSCSQIGAQEAAL
jgi:hypothetical protein